VKFSIFFNYSLIFFKIYKWSHLRLQSSHVVGYNRATCHVIVIVVVFNLVFNLNFLFNLVTLFFKTIQFDFLLFEKKLVIKFNYKLFIHVKIFFFLNSYIKLLYLNIQIILIFTFLPL